MGGNTNAEGFQEAAGQPGSARRVDGPGKAVRSAIRVRGNSRLARQRIDRGRQCTWQEGDEQVLVDGWIDAHAHFYPPEDDTMVGSDHLLFGSDCGRECTTDATMDASIQSILAYGSLSDEEKQHIGRAAPGLYSRAAERLARSERRAAAPLPVLGR